MRSLYVHPAKPKALVQNDDDVTRWDLTAEPRLLNKISVAALRYAHLLGVAPDGTLMVPVTQATAGMPASGSIEIRRWDDFSIVQRIHLEEGSGAHFSGAFSRDGRYLGGTDDEEHIVLIDLGSATQFAVCLDCALKELRR
jgi:hypothetical protein